MKFFVCLFERPFKIQKNGVFFFSWVTLIGLNPAQVLHFQAGLNLDIIAFYYINTSEIPGELLHVNIYPTIMKVQTSSTWSLTQYGYFYFVVLFCQRNLQNFCGTYYNVNKRELLVCLQLAKNCEPKRQSEKKLEILKGRML